MNNEKAAKEFNNFFRFAGGRLHSLETPNYQDILNDPNFPKLGDENLEWFKKRYWFYIKQLYNNDSPYKNGIENTYFDYVDNEKLNATVGKEDKYDFIGIYKGSIQIINLYFYVLMSHPDFMTNTGNEPLPPYWKPDLSKVNWGGTIRELYLDIIANCPHIPLRFINKEVSSRKIRNRDLSIFATDFLFFHEIGHIQNGHLDFIASKGEKMLNEVGKNNMIQPETRHLLELHADAFAVLFILTDFLTFFNSPEMIRTTHFKSPSEPLELFLTAAGLLFLIIDQSESQVEDYQLRNHPHPAIRFFHVYIQSISFVDNHFPEISPAFKDTWKKATQNISDALKLFNLPSSVWNVINTEPNKMITEFNRLMKFWRGGLEKELTPYSKMN